MNVIPEEDFVAASFAFFKENDRYTGIVSNNSR
jgi:hypothetical protein